MKLWEKIEEKTISVYFLWVWLKEIGNNGDQVTTRCTAKNDKGDSVRYKNQENFMKIK